MLGLEHFLQRAGDAVQAQRNAEEQQAQALADKEAAGAGGGRGGRRQRAVLGLALARKLEPGDAQAH